MLKGEFLVFPLALAHGASRIGKADSLLAKP